MNNFYKDKLAEFKIGNVYFQPTLMNGNPYIQKWEYFNNSIHDGQNLYVFIKLGSRNPVEVKNFKWKHLVYGDDMYNLHSTENKAKEVLMNYFRSKLLKVEGK